MDRWNPYLVDELSTLSGFYAYLVATDRLERSPVLLGPATRASTRRGCRGVPLVRSARLLPRILEPAEVSPLLGALCLATGVRDPLKPDTIVSATKLATTAFPLVVISNGSPGMPTACLQPSGGSPVRGLGGAPGRGCSATRRDRTPADQGP